MRQAHNRDRSLQREDPTVGRPAPISKVTLGYNSVIYGDIRCLVGFATAALALPSGADYRQISGVVIEIEVEFSPVNNPAGLKN